MIGYIININTLNCMNKMFLLWQTVGIHVKYLITK